MKGYLSFDVGIKNLAYCRLDENKVIQSWGIINLNENPQWEIMHCDFILIFILFYIKISVSN